MNSQEEKNREVRTPSPEGLVSPFLDGELFARGTDDEWEARLAALEAENSFRRAFEETPGYAIEPEFQQEDGTDKGEETESDLFYAVENFEEEQNTAFNEVYEAPIELEVFGTNDMDSVANALSVPHRWICRLDIEYEITPWNTTRKLSGRGGGTGTLITPCHVLTAAHNITDYDPVQRNYLKAIRIRVTAAHDGSANPLIPTVDADLSNSYVHSRWTVSSRVGAGGAPNPAGEVETNKYDYALLTLKRVIGQRPVKALGNRALGYWTRRGSGGVAYCGPLAPNVLRTNRVFISGYGSDACVMAVRSARSNSAIPLGSQLVASGQLTFIMEGTQTRYVGRGMAHDVDTCGGQSGSPVWIKRNGIYCLVGVHTGAVGLTGGGRANHAVRVTTELVQQVNQWIKKSHCSAQLAKPEREETLETGTHYTEGVSDDHVDNAIKEHEREHDKTPVDYEEAGEDEENINFSDLDDWDQGVNENEGVFDALNDEMEVEALNKNSEIDEFEEALEDREYYGDYTPLPQNLKVTDGQFGLELGHSLRILNPPNVPETIVRILGLSQDFMRMARRLDNRYVSSAEDSFQRTYTLGRPDQTRYDQQGNIIFGTHRGRRVLWIEMGSGPMFRPFGSLGNRDDLHSSSDILQIPLYVGLPTPILIGRLVENIIHEARHAFHHVTQNQPPPPAQDILASINFGINEEITTRNDVIRIVNQIRSAARGRLLLSGYSTQICTDRAIVEREFPGGQNYTYLEINVLEALLGKAQEDENLSAEMISQIEGDIKGFEIRRFRDIEISYSITENLLKELETSGIIPLNVLQGLRSIKKFDEILTESAPAGTEFKRSARPPGYKSNLTYGVPQGWKLKNSEWPVYRKRIIEHAQKLRKEKKYAILLNIKSDGINILRNRKEFQDKSQHANSEYAKLLFDLEIIKARWVLFKERQQKNPNLNMEQWFQDHANMFFRNTIRYTSLPPQTPCTTIAF